MNQPTNTLCWSQYFQAEVTNLSHKIITLPENFII